MKKLIGLFLFLSTLLIAVQFNGHQSLNGLNATRLFTAPASAIYFINGTLSIPQPSQNGGTGASQAVVTVSKNGTTVIYSGVAGANGFGIPVVSLVSNDSVSMSITSNASIDQGINVIQGDVFFGNAF